MIKEPDWTNPQLTYGDLLHPAMKVRSHAEASVYFEKLVDYCMKFAKPKVSREKAIAVQKANLGYFAGYYDDATAVRVQKYFQCVHPIFGSTTPEGKEAFDAGRKAGKKLGKLREKSQPSTDPSRPRKRTLILED